MQSKIPLYPYGAKEARERGEIENGARASVRIAPVQAESISSFGKVSTGCI